MDTLARDLRYAARTLKHMRGVAIVAILTLSLGFGATTTMFSVVHALLLRPPPFANAERLVILFNTSASPREGLRQWRWSLANISELGRVAASFDAVGSFTGPLLTGCRDHEDSKNTKAHEENLVCTKRIFLVSSCLRGHGRARYNAAHERSTRRC